MRCPSFHHGYMYIDYQPRPSRQAAVRRKSSISTYEANGSVSLKLETDTGTLNRRTRTIPNRKGFWSSFYVLHTFPFRFVPSFFLFLPRQILFLHYMATHEYQCGYRHGLVTHIFQPSFPVCRQI
jgi:hypothetical protein